MGKTANQMQGVNNWNMKEAYEKVNNDIKNWPEWKKEAYNEMFAVSAHGGKIAVGR